MATAINRCEYAPVPGRSTISLATSQSLAMPIVSLSLDPAGCQKGGKEYRNIPTCICFKLSELKVESEA